MDEPLKAAGVDVAGAKAALVELNNAFSGDEGPIPDGALSHWVDQWFSSPRAVFLQLGRVWEKEIEQPKKPKKK
jgi:hypothetical protein